MTYSEVAAQLSPHSQAIVIFALCGFANPVLDRDFAGRAGCGGSGRRDDIFPVWLSGADAASLSNLMSAALAGFFLTLGAA